METSKHKVWIICIIILFMLSYKSVNSTSMKTSKKIDLHESSFAVLNLFSQGGKVSVSSKNLDSFLADCEFDFSKEEWAPEISASSKNEVVYLDIKMSQKLKDFNIGRREKNNWEIVLHNRVPYDIHIHQNAGECYLDLSSVKLGKLNLKLNAGNGNFVLNNTSPKEISISSLAGNTIVDLTGNWHNSCKGELKLGVGNQKIILSKNIGIKLEIFRTIGGFSIQGLKKQGSVYVNDKYGESDINMELRITSGIGNLDIKTR